MQSQSELFIYSSRFSWLYKLEIITEWDARLHTQCSRTGILSCCSTVHSLEREGNDLLPGKWRGCCIKPWAKTQQLIFRQHYAQSDNHNYLILLRPATFVRQRENEGLNSPEEKHIKKQPTTITYHWTFFFFLTKLFVLFCFLLRESTGKHKRDCCLWQSSITWTYPIHSPQAISSSSSSWRQSPPCWGASIPTHAFVTSLLLQKA